MPILITVLKKNKNKKLAAYIYNIVTFLSDTWRCVIMYLS